jgi:hypothetical protein
LRSNPWCKRARRSDPAADHGRGKPAKLHADKAYDLHELRTWLRRRDIIVRIVRKGIETSKKTANSNRVTCYKKLARETMRHALSDKLSPEIRCSAMSR